MAAFEVADTAKTDSAYLYSCLLTRANAIEKGLNPPCSFNSVSALRNRPPGDPNCALFPQGPIFPYRPVGACGIIGPFPQVGMQKGSLRTRKFGGRCSHYFAGGLALWRRRNSIRRYSAAPKCELRSQFPLFPLDGFGSVVPSFQLHPVFGIDTERVPPNDAISRFVGFGDKSWDNLKNFFQTQGIEFLFLSQRSFRP